MAAHHGARLVLVAVAGGSGCIYPKLDDLRSQESVLLLQDGDLVLDEGKGTGRLLCLLRTSCQFLIE